LKVLDLNENAWIAHAWLCTYNLKQGRTVKALQFAEKAHALVPSQLGLVGILAGILKQGGDQQQSEALLSQLGAGEAPGAPSGLFFFHMICGELDDAAQW